MTPLQADGNPETPLDGRTAFRLQVARRDIPPLLVAAGVLVVVFSVTSYFADPSSGIGGHAADVPMGLAFIVVGLVLPRTQLPDAAYPRLFAAMITLLVFAFLFEIWRTPEQLAMTYVLLVMCAFGPPTLAWRPFLAAATAMVVAASLVTRTWAGPQWLDWTLASLAAVTISAVLLRTRLRSVGLLADASALVQRLATTDELTGLINRHGLSLQLTTLVANATRYNQPLFVAFVDVVGLKAANDRHGHDFGDDVLQCVARAVSNAVRDGDLVARWGGDEFIVVGLGGAPDAKVLSDRLHASIAHSGINLDQWAGRVSLGLAETAGQHIDVDQLISAADEDMYRRRLAT